MTAAQSSAADLGKLALEQRRVVPRAHTHTSQQRSKDKVCFGHVFLSRATRKQQRKRDVYKSSFCSISCLVSMPAFAKTRHLDWIMFYESICLTAGNATFIAKKLNETLHAVICLFFLRYVLDSLIS